MTTRKRTKIVHEGRCHVLEGALAVQAGENPRIVEMRLASFL